MQFVKWCLALTIRIGAGGGQEIFRDLTRREEKDNC